MFIVTEDGKKIRLNEEDLEKYGWDKDGYFRIKNGLVALNRDGAYMDEVWIATVYIDKNFCTPKRGIDLDFQAEVKFDHEPTQEEMLYLAQAYGNGSHETYVDISKMYRWNCDYKD